jgi:hypothetical protein
MRSLDNMHMQLRQTVWERQYWKGADRNGDRVLSFNELKDLCVRLNVHFPKGELERMFKVRFTITLRWCVYINDGLYNRKPIRRQKRP